MPRHLLPLILMIATLPGALVSCQKGDDEKNPSKQVHSGAANDDAGTTVTDLAKLARHDSGTYTYKGELFTGRAVELNADGERVREEHFWEGYQHGPVRVFYESGRPKNDTNYTKGVPDGIGLEWDEDGNMVQVMYKDGVEQSRSEPRKTNFN